MQNHDAFIESFRGLNMRFSRLYAQLLMDADLSLQQFTLLNLLNLAGSMTMTDMSERLHISKPAVTNLVDRLEDLKLVKRCPHPEDRRINLLEVQPKGKKVVESIQSVVFSMLTDTVETFSEKDQGTIHKFYDAMSAEMDRQFHK